jgi:tetraacyldisaccharide 4'-kinase
VPESRDARLAWQRRLGPLLAPAGWGYSTIQRIRRLAYRRGWLQAHSCAKPVISVGSLLAGGSGKTPFVVHLADRLAAHRVAILSRGFGGQARAPFKVERDADPRMCGDEPLLLKRRTSAAVWVYSNRAQLARQLVNDYDLFLLDDGYQHLTLRRNLNICLVPDLPLGAVLPAGLWREGPSALADADFVVALNDLPNWLKAHYTGPVARVELVPGDWQSHAGHGVPPRRVLAFCGIARPERFIESLAEYDVVESVHFADHHAYTDAELDSLWRRALDLGAEALLTTAKDVVRIGRVPSGLPLYFRDVSVRWIQGEALFGQALADAVGEPDQS